MVLGKSDEGGYYKTYGSDAEGEKGYLEATYSKGNHGYKTLDTFHKRDGDKYAFEKHVAYGKARAEEKSGREHDAASRSSKGDDHEGAGTTRRYNVKRVIVQPPREWREWRRDQAEKRRSLLIRELGNMNF